MVQVGISAERMTRGRLNILLDALEVDLRSLIEPVVERGGEPTRLAFGDELGLDMDG